VRYAGRLFGVSILVLSCSFGFGSGLEDKALDGDVRFDVVVAKECDHFSSDGLLDSGDEIIAHGLLVGLPHVEHELAGAVGDEAPFAFGERVAEDHGDDRIPSRLHSSCWARKKRMETVETVRRRPRFSEVRPVAARRELAYREKLAQAGTGGAALRVVVVSWRACGSGRGQRELLMVGAAAIGTAVICRTIALPQVMERRCDVLYKLCTVRAERPLA
jgi:hypothetical protein